MKDDRWLFCNSFICSATPIPINHGISTDMQLHYTTKEVHTHTSQASNFAGRVCSLQQGVERKHKGYIVDEEK